MNKTERLLRIAGLLIIIRDELEEQEYKQRKKQIVNRFIKCANAKLNELSNGGQDVNKEYELVYTHIHKSISSNFTSSLMTSLTSRFINSIDLCMCV